MRLIAFLCCLLTIAASFAQSYKPKAGETVLKVDIEGRGTYFISLFTKDAPKTTAHILKLVKDKFYDGQRYHRVEKSPKPFLVQVGDPKSKKGNLEAEEMGTGGSGAKIPFEDSGYSNKVGMVGLAASPTNRDSGDSQFYVLLDSASFLDGNYTVFGKVVAGMDVVRRIERGDRVTAITLVRD
jgi:cyclophilin family peptidyl-prolyl cis-trans isomerase